MSAVQTEPNVPQTPTSPGPESSDVGSPPSGLQRQRSRHTSRAYEAEGEALGQIAKDAEARIALRRAARAEARDIRMKEIEKQQQEEEKAEKEGDKDKDNDDKRALRQRKIRALIRGQSTATTSSNHSNSSSRRGSIDSIENDPVRLEYEEKYKKAMMTNASLDNEKSALIYEVEALKDMIEEQEEQVHEYQREAKDKHRELQAKKRESNALQREVENLKELVTQRDELIAQHGLLLGEEDDEDDSSDDSSQNKSKEKAKKNTQIGSIVVLSPEAVQLLESSGDGPLDVRLKRFVDEKKEYMEQIDRLNIELEEAKEKANERRKSTPSLSPNGPDLELLDLQRESARQANEYKFKLQRAEQEVATLETSVSRLDGQVRRYKSQVETAEKLEEELKSDSRKMKREIRSLTSRVEELETENKSLSKKIEKLRKKDPGSLV